MTLSDDSIVIYGGEAVYADGNLAGRVRSGGYGYTLGKNIALSYLPLELTKMGTPVEVEVFGERIPAQVTADVLYDPDGERLRV
jgi:glycine cleavage system aminomethyltransferase T